MRIDRCSKLILSASLILCLSIMYQIYFVGFHDGVIVGGGFVRFFLKTLFLFLFILAVKNYLSWDSLCLNVFYKIPLFYILITITILIPFLSGAYLQTLNILFFFPILFINWNKGVYGDLYKLIWKVIVAVVFVQLLLDPIFKAYTDVGWTNNALIGGMGNPNVFGIFLIVSGLASAIMLPSRYRYLSLVLFPSTMLTGSLVATIIGLSCFIVQIFCLLWRAPFRTLFFIFTPLSISIFIFSKQFVSDHIPVDHVFNKFIALRQFIVGEYESGSESISARLNYFEYGLELISNSPLSLIFGHPGFMPMYNGDGLWVSFLVTYGLPITLFFLIVNLLLSYRGIVSRSPDFLFSGCVLLVMLVFFITNRILDYWPAALIYMLVFSYLSTKGVKRVKRAKRKIIVTSFDLTSKKVPLSHN